jgi:hypothetical protein
VRRFQVSALLIDREVMLTKSPNPKMDVQLAELCWHHVWETPMFNSSSVLVLLLSCLISGADAADASNSVDKIFVEETGVGRPIITRWTSDLRVGICGNVGSLTRHYDSGGTDTNATYAEYGAWLSYTRTVSNAWPNWRWEGYLTGQQAAITGDQQDGKMTSWLGGLGLGYSPDLLSAWDGHLQTEIKPFVGVGRSSYRNDFSATSGAYTYNSQVDASGTAIEYGLSLSLLWIFSSGWEVATQIGYVEKRTALSGTTTSETSGISSSGPFETHDQLKGVRYGLFFARRF